MSATLVLNGIIIMVGLLVCSYFLSRLITALIYRGSVIEGDAEPGPDESPSLVDRVVASGPIVATAMCGGSLGLLAFRSGMRVDVHPAGVLLKLVMMPAMVLLREEITAVRVVEALFLNDIEIVHSSPRLTAPVRLSCREGSELHAALLAIAPPPAAAAAESAGEAGSERA